MVSNVMEENTLKQSMIGISVGYTNPFLHHTYKQSELKLIRLEKGLLLFNHLYGSTKTQLNLDVTLWENKKLRLKTDSYSKEYSNITSSCDEKSVDTHRLKEFVYSSRYIQTQTDHDVYLLIRFIQKFTLYYFDQAIRDPSALYRDMLMVMVHLVHRLSPKRQRSVQHLYLFLGKSTVQQLMPKKILLDRLMEPLDVPVIFFKRHLDFQEGWYRSNAARIKINFDGLSSDFIHYFNRILIRYYEGRLKSGGLKKAWA